MPGPPNLEFDSNDTSEIRAIKDVIKYGNHTPECPRENEVPVPEGIQHECCTCGWCLASESAEITLMFFQLEQPKGWDILTESEANDQSTG